MPTDKICYTDLASGRIIWKWDEHLTHWTMFAFVEHK